jgi:molybdate transport system permease protein
MMKAIAKSFPTRDMPHQAAQIAADAERTSTVRRGRSTASINWLLVGAGLPLLILLALPLFSIVAKLVPAQLLNNLHSASTREAIGLSLATSTITTLMIVLFGMPIAYLLGRRRFRFSRLMEVFIDLPTVLPPAVAGLALLMAFGRRGLLGGAFEVLGIQIAFTTLAVVMAQAFVSAPYFVKAATLGLAGVSTELLQAAAIDGAQSFQIFRYITLPLAWRGLIGGLALCWARALGEFGATIMFAGNYPGRTQTMPLAVYISFETDLSQALTLAAILMAFSFIILFTVRATRGTVADI